MRDGDAAAVNGLLSQIVRVHHKVRPDLFRAEFHADDNNVRQSEDEPLFVAVNEENNVVGCIWCLFAKERDNTLKVDRDWLCIDDICVEEAYRGQGIGKKLMEFAAGLAREKGLDRIQLNVYEDNAAAVRFYESLGFATQKRVLELIVPVESTRNLQN